MINASLCFLCLHVRQGMHNVNFFTAKVQEAPDRLNSYLPAGLVTHLYCTFKQRRPRYVRGYAVTINWPIISWSSSRRFTTSSTYLGLDHLIGQHRNIVVFFPRSSTNHMAIYSKTILVGDGSVALTFRMKKGCFDDYTKQD